MGETVTTHKTTVGRGRLYGHPTGESYKELELVAIPESIPELGIDAGCLGTVDHVYKGGRKADVAVSYDDDGVIFGYVTVEADPEPHVVAYYAMDDD